MNLFFIYLCLVIFFLTIPGIYIIDTGIHLINHNNKTDQWANCTVKSISIINVSESIRDVRYHLLVHIRFMDYYYNYSSKYSHIHRSIHFNRTFTCTIDQNYDVISLREKSLPYHSYVDSFDVWFGAVIYYSLGCIFLVLFPSIEYYRRKIESSVLSTDRHNQYRDLKWEEKYKTSLLDV